MKKTNKMVFISLLVAQALVLQIFESMMPVPFITPGSKLGLANIVTVIAIYSLSASETLLIIFLRLLLATMFYGNLSSLLYSMSGAMLSYIAMYLVKILGRNNVTVIGVSATGAVFHNIGQITMAALMIQSINITLYLPILTISGIGTGIFVGITAKYILSHLDKINKNSLY